MLKYHPNLAENTFYSKVVFPGITSSSCLVFLYKVIFYKVLKQPKSTQAHHVLYVTEEEVPLTLYAGHSCCQP